MTVKWKSATAIFKALGEPVDIPKHDNAKHGQAYRQVSVEVTFSTGPIVDGVGGSGGHAGNGLWWDAPLDTFNVALPVSKLHMSRYDAVQLAKWILQMSGEEWGPKEGS